MAVPPARIGGVMKLARDPLLRRPVCAAGQPAHPQVSQRIGLPGSDHNFPVLTGRSGTQRARRPGSRTTAGTSAPWSSSSSSELRTTRVFSCVARGFKARPSFMFAGCCWWRSQAVVRAMRSRRHGDSPPRRHTRPARQARAGPASVGGPHGQETAQDPHRLPLLPRLHPRQPRRERGIVTGEPSALKGARWVRREAARKRPGFRIPEPGTSPRSPPCYSAPH